MTSAQAPTVCRLVVPAYNEAARIVRCLESVRASYLPLGFEWEEWVVHDGDSTDGTAQMAESWAASRPLVPLRVVRAARRSGKAAALGAYHAELVAQGQLGHLVVILDADSAVAPGALDSLLRAFAQDPSLGVAWGMDEIDSRRVGYWASAYQMEAMAALAHRLGTNAPRAYGRLFAYRVAALAGFCWQAGLIADDTQLAAFVRDRSIPVRTVEEARALVTPAASSQDLHLQTQKGIAARTRVPGRGRDHCLASPTVGRRLRRSPCGQRRSPEAVADLVRRLVGTSSHDEAGHRGGVGRSLRPRSDPKAPTFLEHQSGLARSIWMRGSARIAGTVSRSANAVGTQKSASRSTTGVDALGAWPC